MDNLTLRFYKLAPGEGHFTDRKATLLPPESLFFVLRSVVNTHALNKPDRLMYNPTEFSIISAPVGIQRSLTLEAWSESTSDESYIGRFGRYESPIWIGAVATGEAMLFDTANRSYALDRRSSTYLSLLSEIPGEHRLSW